MDTVQEWLEPIRKNVPDTSYEHSAIEAVYEITKVYMREINKLQGAIIKARHLFECERDSQGMKICDEALTQTKREENE